MVIIPGVAAAPPAAAARRRRLDGAGFALPEDAPAPAPAAAAALPALGLLAMQEAAGADAADRAARQQGEALVQELGALQLALLSGTPAAAGGRLASLARNPAQAADPRLAAVLGALRLRAEVELARAAAGAEGCASSRLRRKSDT